MANANLLTAITGYMIAVTMGALVLPPVIHRIGLMLGSKTKKEKSAVVKHILFFPSSTNDNYHILSETIESARATIDVCVYAITNRKLVRILINAHSRGVVVRVITDQEQESICGGEIWRLRGSGIQVRTNCSSPYYMHHKYCIIDQSNLINGSLNWTAQGVECNEENVTITDDVTTVKAFMNHFNKLWEQYNTE